MIIDGEKQKESLFDMIIKTQESSNPNNVIKFSDNSRYVSIRRKGIACNY